MFISGRDYIYYIERTGVDYLRFLLRRVDYVGHWEKMLLKGEWLYFACALEQFSDALPSGVVRVPRYTFQQFLDYKTLEAVDPNCPNSLGILTHDNFYFKVFKAVPLMASSATAWSAFKNTLQATFTASRALN